MTDLGRGYYILTIWANAGGVSPPELRAWVKNTYGEAYIQNLGKMAASNVQFGSLEQEFRRSIDDGADAEHPSMADLNGGVITVGGETPSLISVILGEAKKDVVAVAEYGGKVGDRAINATLNLAEWLPMLLIVGGIVYLAYVAHSSGALKRVAAK